MKVLGGLEGEPIGPCAVTIGTFDGVHLAHAAALHRLSEVASGAGWTSVVVTFDTHPRCVLDPERCPSLLTPLPEKLTLLRDLGVGAAWVIPFTRSLSALSAAEFMALLATRLQLKHLICGPDFALGHERAGDIAWLRGHGAEHGYEVEVMPALTVDGVELHSSDIRRLLEGGEISASTRLLGRPYRLSGPVVAGVQAGRALGYPTANIAVPADKLVPADGVYAATVEVLGGRQKGALSIGSRPTFDATGRVVEVHLLDFEGDLYGQEMEISLVARLRGQVRYDSPEALARQMAVDIEETRRLLEP